MKKSTGARGSGSGTAKKGIKARGAPPASAQKKKRRSGSGMSRADVEIMLQQAVTTPSRRLRNGKK